ncbi:Protocatechuate 3,4-dioxygenase, alpha subunit OS=Tsukamurella paurometabola (strain ATCC 8368 / DSM / CCUG 35730 / CIP 100753 / JCM 10117 / KCTC 9821 /NBRC 16120 / NCIMB 702349 / NCTC 13040) OX=521096 GN=Tpau_0616 PE=3 SV=1 [Tsukamurella paurometabola]|uniref:Protocatechuate 3,4-dioxygenase, alpha subunit n=1 Tax=Tsukamurella paurometabola (strain ATCC 8368 / DSM 20162 / CCUG 35730 / CIP 100753 / JCM 10117 / KCTC 9821 / NBRC 16120 / NCIMB 702349 / NCTC 13040) TaxID=521096 RepID=D5USW7_TSUPD|nr:protocatechuate 3,4-dioxygenase subunit alpha [Tsukamurella paurometabola]ADG77254.1 protocatechuate 3,4-dioxygenase, alpha subunit [Tsukamurella paurometabola DSM 20162]SUP43294.1 Protocatechuate 3,4-dioxygenase alpha chain [Tsukamurella paurometabola]
MTARSRTPDQTIGPFFGDGLSLPGAEHLIAPGHPRAIRLSGTVFDGAGDPVPDCLLEIWQPDEQGRPARPAALIPRDGHSLQGWVRDPHDFAGWGRAATGHTGRFGFTTVEPGPAQPGAAPFISVAVFARGLLTGLFTRVYPPEATAALAADPLLSTLPTDRRSTVIAQRGDDGSLRWDIRLQGERETVFLDFVGAGAR